LKAVILAGELGAESTWVLMRLKLLEH